MAKLLNFSVWKLLYTSFFDTLMAKYTMPQPKKGQYHTPLFLFHNYKDGTSTSNTQGHPLLTHKHIHKILKLLIYKTQTLSSKTATLIYKTQSLKLKR